LAAACDPGRGESATWRFLVSCCGRVVIPAEAKLVHAEIGKS